MPGTFLNILPELIHSVFTETLWGGTVFTDILQIETGSEMLRTAWNLGSYEGKLEFDLEPGWRAIEMKGLRTEAPPPGHARTSFSVGSSTLWSVGSSTLQWPLEQTDLYQFRSEPLCPVVMEACKGFRGPMGPIVNPCLSLPQGSVTRSIWPVSGCQMIISMFWAPTVCQACFTEVPSFLTTMV